MPVRCLSFHAAYRCRHSGACCSADWEIPIEPHRAGVLVLTRGADGQCGFRQDDRCALQVARGEAMLPSACRHFPRVFLQDARGTSLTLSHFCPTAARMLLDEAEISIVDAEPPLALAEPLEGLDARGALPPLLRPGMLMDAAGYDAWELAVVQAFADSPAAEHAFSAISTATERLRRWSPPDGDLAAAARAAFRQPARPVGSLQLSRGFDVVRTLTGPHPVLEPPRDFEAAWLRTADPGDAPLHGAIARYLAAATFGNWIAYRGEGLRSIVQWLRACYDVLRVQLLRELGHGILRTDGLVEAFRTTDYIMVHTVDSQAFGRAVASVER